MLKILIKKHSNIPNRIREENVPGISTEMYSLEVNGITAVMIVTVKTRLFMWLEK